MVKIVSFFFTLLCVCFTVVHCHNQLAKVDPWRDPRVWPDTFVEDGKPFVEFSCGAYLKSTEFLSWHKEGNYEQDLSIIKPLKDGYTTLKLLWPLASLKNVKLLCRKRHRTRTLSKSKSIPITFKNNNYPNITEKGFGPWLMPAEFVDDGKRIEFTSYAYLSKGGRLSCYQKKDKSISELGMIQQENEYSYVKITLPMTLKPSDNGSIIYCTRQEKNGKKYNSISIPIKFERQIEALEPNLTVEPSTDVVFFDEGDDLEFVCSGSEPDDGRNLTWYLQTPDLPLYQVKPSYQYFYKHTNLNRLTLSIKVFDHEKLLYCTQELPHETVPKNGELLLRTRNIMLLHRAQCDTRDQPRVFPPIFVDEHKPYVQFTCYAFLKPGQLLSWYQSTGLNKSAGSLLRMIQLQDPKTKEGEWTVLTLNKTLEPSDNGSEIYCAQQSVRTDWSFSDVKQTQRIALTVQRDIPFLEQPFIRIEPNNATVSFHVNTTLRLTCGGSKPVDGKTYTWFKKESNSSLTVPKDQKYDASTNLTVLDLSLNESHHLNELFCAQGFLSYIRDTDGTHVMSYGELVKSNITTLIRVQQEKDEEKQELPSPTCPAEKKQELASPTPAGNTQLLLMVATPLALFSLLAATTACWALRRRRAARPAPPAPAPQPNIDDNYGDYANISRIVSPQVTYAVLDLPRRAIAARAPPAQEQAVYAEIAREPPEATYATVDLPKAARAPPAPDPSLYAEIARGHKRKH